MIHQVKFSIPERDLGKADIEFAVKRGGAKMGTLKVSKGGIEWVKRDFTFGKTLTWKDFDEMMEAQKVKK